MFCLTSCDFCVTLAYRFKQQKKRREGGKEGGREKRGIGGERE
jgi:hypothetical protein